MGCRGSKGSIVVPEISATVPPDSPTQLFAGDSCHVRDPTQLFPGDSFHARYDVLENLGRGSYAQVHRARRISTGAEVAVKITDLRKKENSGAQETETDSVRRRDFDHEVGCLVKVKPFISCMQLIDSMLDSSFAYIIAERCDHNLFQYLDRVISVLDETTLFRTFKDMLRPVADIHSVHIVHRDLKPDNYMVKDGVVKLCDFGFAARIPANQISFDRCGTSPFMSPEMLKNRGHGLKTDVWSFTVIVYVLLFGAFPYQPDIRDSESMRNAVMNATPKPTFFPLAGLPHISERARRFVNAIFSRNPSSRMNAKGVLRELSKCIDSGELQELVCLRSTLKSARRFGAIVGSRRNVDKESFVDTMLKDVREKKGQTIQCVASIETFGPVSSTTLASTGSRNRVLSFAYSSATSSSQIARDTSLLSTASKLLYFGSDSALTPVSFSDIMSSGAPSSSSNPKPTRR